MKLDEYQTSFIRDAIKIIFISVIIIVPVRLFVVQSFFVVGISMQPSYENGDYLLVDKISYRFSKPNRGDVIVFKSPTEKSETYIKRIIGLPYDTIVLRNDKVQILSEGAGSEIVIEEDYIQGSTGKHLDDGADMVVSLGEDEYFVMGDNRSDSWDSRFWGSLEESEILGKVWLRLWPVSSVNFITKPSYEGL